MLTSKKSRIKSYRNQAVQVCETDPVQVCETEQSERAKWISDYMALQTKEERIHALRDLHFRALSEAAIVPLVISPFVAMARKPWKMELSELYADNQLWLIKH